MRLRGFSYRHDANPAPNQQEASVAKGQKNSNREIKKPKAKKVAVVATSESPFSKGSLTPISAKKKS